MKKIVLISGFLMFTFSLFSQDYLQLIAEGTHTVEDIVEVAERHFDVIGRERGTGYKPFRRWQYFAERLMDETGKLKSNEFYYNELQDYNARFNEEGVASRTVVGTWEEKGPTYWNATAGWNPGVGRITSIAIEDTNLDHIIAGSETGGVWKSVDGGSSWTVLTDNLANIDVYALTIDPLDNMTYYWGSSGGSIFKSTNGGSTWALLSSLPGGIVNKILIHPTDTSKMYCSAQGGGLYKSTDGGSSWTIIDNTAKTGYDFEFKPGDPNTIYASGNLFYVSTDGGITFSYSDGLDTWQQEYVSGSNNWVSSSSNQNGSITPRTGNSMAFLNINNYTFPTTKIVSPGLDLSSAINPELKFSYSQVNWVGNIDELKVFYKASQAGSWVELAHYTAEAANWTDITLNLPNPSSDYYVAFEGKANWSRGLTLDDVSVEASNLGIVFFDGFEPTLNEFSSGPKMIGVSADDSSIVYVVEAENGRFGGFHKSINSGSNFSKLSNDLYNYFGYSSTGNDSSGQAPRDMDIAVNPNDVNDVHIAGVNTWRSTDGGVNFGITSQWTPDDSASLNIGYCHADVDLMMFAGTGVDVKLYVGTDGGVFKANNPTVVNGRYYTDLTSGMGIRQFYRIGISQTNPVVVTGGSQDNGTSVMSANGSWTDWLGADGMEGFVDKSNSQIMYGMIQFGGMNKTTNGGINAFGLTNPAGDGNWNWVVPFEQDPLIENTIFVAYNEVFKSIDGGISWISASQNFGANIDHFKVAPTNSNKMYLAINGAFWYTSNGGLSWLQSALNLGGGRINEIVVHPTNPDKIAIATTNSQKVYISTNNGISWESIRWDLPNFSAQALAWQNNGDDGLYVGMNYGVYYTDNEIGNTWVPFNNGLPNVRINELEINTADDKIYAATYGRGLWSSNVYDESLSIQGFVFNDLSLYPNPANTEVNIKWNKPEDVSVRIYDTLGKIVYYGKKVNLFSGFKIDVSAFNSGVYYVKLNSAKGEITKKLILK